MGAEVNISRTKELPRNDHAAQQFLRLVLEKLGIQGNFQDRRNKPSFLWLLDKLGYGRDTPEAEIVRETVLFLIPEAPQQLGGYDPRLVETYSGPKIVEPWASYDPWSNTYRLFHGDRDGEECITYLWLDKNKLVTNYPDLDAMKEACTYAIQQMLKQQ